ncbi:MAG: NPCBM/NEW2 domain-containing protein [Thermoguttaceae bacterium]
MLQSQLKFVASFLSLVFFCAILSAEEPKDVPPIKVIYFMPSDMQAFPDCHERLGRVMRCVQDFFRVEMERNKFGSKTFALEWDAPDKIKLYMITGKRKRDEYGRDDAALIHSEIREMMKAKYGINVDEEVNVVFQTLLKWEAGKAVEVGPYCASGSHLSGLAFVYDDPLLDSAFLSSKEPGGYYGGPCSIGQFNTHYIGGVAHELGHAFGLPHNAELETDKDKFGYSLMGGGNHTFGKKLRNEGRDTFLTRTDAMRLSPIRAFAGTIQGAKDSTQWKLKKLEAVEQKESDKKPNSRRFLLKGEVEATPPLIGVIVYNDNANVNGDYDAKSFTSDVDAKGQFQFFIEEFTEAPYKLRLVGVHESGKTSSSNFIYETKNGKLDLSQINNTIPLEYLRKCYNEKNIAKLQEIADKKSVDSAMRDCASHAIKLLREPQKLYRLSDLPESVKRADLCYAEFIDEKVGWHGRVHRGQIPEDIFIQLEGKLFESAFYAHADSVIKIDLNGKWETLDIGYGRQYGHSGNLIFTINGDAKELFKSEKISDYKDRRVKISVKGVKTLELIIQAIDGNTNAWSVWTSPNLSRE